MLRLTRCSADDAGFRSALVAAGLPVEDLGELGASYFSASGAFGGFVGTGPDRLLRSVVVPEAARGNGIGSQIVDMIADRARDEGAARLWLLTTDASRFFSSLGWVEVDRSTAPEAIKTTTQFASVCPASASLMVRDL